MATAEEKFGSWFEEQTSVEIFDHLNGESQDSIVNEFVDDFDFAYALLDNMEDSKLDAEGFAKDVLDAWDEYLRHADFSNIENTDLNQPFTDDDDPELAADEREGEDDGPAEPEQP